MKQSFWFFGAHVSIVADGQATAGCYDLIEGDFTPGSATPWHLHKAYTEDIYVLEGELTVHTKGQTTVLRAGENALIPAGIAHRVVGSSAGPARALTVASPSGFARLIRTLGAPAVVGSKPAGAPNLIKAALALAEGGDEMLGVMGVLMSVARWWGKLTAKAA